MDLNDDVIEHVYKLAYGENKFESCLILRSLSKQWLSIFEQFMTNETLFEETLASFHLVYSSSLLKKYKFKYMFTNKSYNAYKYKCASCGNYNDGILTCPCMYYNLDMYLADHETLSPPFSPTASTVSYWSGNEEYL